MNPRADALRLSLLAALGITSGGCGARVDPDAAPPPTAPPVTCDPIADNQGNPGIVSCTNGVQHREVAKACELARSSEVKFTAGTCSSDLDCTEHPNGFCGQNMNVVGPTIEGVCMYQFTCITDSDCAANQLCLCGIAGSYCVSASCRVDADCGKGNLCFSFVNDCRSPSFACPSPNDECATAADCTDFRTCLVNPDHRVCGSGGQVCGRPFLVNGAMRRSSAARSDTWMRTVVPELPDSAHVRAALSAHWVEIGLMEHASIAAFARFALQLLSLGAPAQLVADTTEAMKDEIEHARVSFALASAYGGSPLAPGPLDVSGALSSTTLEDVVRLVFVEGCIGETMAALEVGEAATSTKDTALAEVLTRIAADESRHAALAWRFVAWSSQQDRQLVLRVIREELRRLEPSDNAVRGVDADLQQWGVLSERTRKVLSKTAMSDVIRPCCEALS